MKNKPLISVIVPVYNREKHLRKCIESITAQTYENLEIILVNDGSTDNSLKICLEASKIDSRIKVVDKENGGPSSARNRGIDEAKGEFIAFVDSDDDIESTMYEVLLDDIVKNAADVSIVGMQYVYLNGDKRMYVVDKEKTLIKGDDILNVFFENQVITFAPVDKLYRREIIGDIRFDTSIKMCEDQKFNYEYLKKVSRVSYNPCVMYNINCTDNSLSRAKPTRYHLSMIDVNEYIISDLASEKAIDKIRLYNVGLCLSFFVLNYNNGQFLEQDIDRINKIIYQNTSLILKKGDIKMKLKLVLFLISPKLLRKVLLAK